MRELAGVIAEPFSTIYQCSWMTGEVPEDWRLADVTPIYKKGHKEDPGNYRPVGLASVPGKGHGSGSETTHLRVPDARTMVAIRPFV